jgi:ribosome-associated protein
MTKPQPAALPAQLPDTIRRTVEAAFGRKATGMTVLDLRESGAFADFFVICSGQNVRQVKAIVDAVEQSLATLGLHPSHIEGYARAEWVLMDYFDFIVHVFTPQTRAFYSLERLWGGARQFDLADQPARV